GALGILPCSFCLVADGLDLVDGPRLTDGAMRFTEQGELARLLDLWGFEHNGRWRLTTHYGRRLFLAVSCEPVHGRVSFQQKARSAYGHSAELRRNKHGLRHLQGRSSMPFMRRTSGRKAV